MLRNIFLILRLVPDLIYAHYELNYDHQDDGFFLNLIKPLYMIPLACASFTLLALSGSGFRAHSQKEIEEDFSKIRKKNEVNVNNDNNGKPVCAYFVSSFHGAFNPDGFAAITSAILRLYHHVKIAYYQNFYTVYPFVVGSLKELNEKIQTLPKKVQLCNIVAHGNNESIYLTPEEETKRLPRSLKKDTDSLEINNLARDADIVLDCCSVAEDADDCIAKKMAESNKGRNVFGPTTYLCCSSPNLSIDNTNQSVHVDSVDHGFCVVTPYEMRRLQCRG